MEEIYKECIKIPGYTDIRELRFLYHWAKTLLEKRKYLKIVEVGSFWGRTAALFSLVDENRVTVYAIDSWSGYCTDIYNFLKKNKNEISNINEYFKYLIQTNIPIENAKNCIENFKFYTRNYKNIIPVKAYSPHDFYNKWNEEIDIFFLDASHKNPNDWENIEFWMKFIRKGGILCGHDYNTLHFPDVVSNVEKLKKILNQNPEIVYSLWKFDL
ncbi:MAG: class I SAM-dependent methyltransferase [Candidatus Dojkabacteria bacterium]|nr:class I SAM-dependent methyltransferase [Candidatus Dojkabacteria bacterium]